MSDQTTKISSINKKLVNGFLVIIFFALVYFTASYLLVQKSKTLVEDAINKQFNTSIFISKLAIDGQKLRRYEKEYFIYLNNDEKRNKYAREWTEAKDSIQSRLDEAIADKKNTWALSDKSKLTDWLLSLNDYSDEFNGVITRVEGSVLTTTIDANLAIRKGKNAFRVFLKGTSELGTQKFNEARKSVEKINQNFQYINIAMIFTSVLGFLVLIIVLRRVLKAVETPILNLTKSADEMSKGRINQEIQQPNIQEFQTLYTSLERLRTSQKILIEKLMKK